MGGIVNPETGQVDWTFHVPLEEQVAFYRAHPPSALSGLTARPIEVDFRFDGHGEPVNAIFELTCACGSALFVATCIVDDDSVAPPITLHCEGCEAEHVVYDRARHGYDAVAGGLPTEEPGDDSYPDDIPTDDVSLPYQVIVRFEFPSDHLGDAEWKGREQELFSWITFLARDPSSGALEFLFDDECA